jgi:hypothetical protein
LKHPDETFVTYTWRQTNTWNMRLKHLPKHMKTLEKVIAKHMQHPDKTFATYVWNIWNIKINTLATYVEKKQMKHLE